MARFTVRRLANMVFVLIAISIITFFIFYKIPGGDPVLRISGRTAEPAVREQVREDFGFNDPIYVQYLRMMEKTFNGSLESYSNRVNVREELIRGIPATASLVIGGAIIWLFFGILFGVISAVYAGRYPDRVITILGLIGISLPVFWVGAMLLYYLTYKVALFPAGGYVPLTEDPASWFSHMILPWFTHLARVHRFLQPAAAVQHARRDERGLRAHGARQGAVGAARARPATCSATP